MPTIRTNCRPHHELEQPKPAWRAYRCARQSAIRDNRCLTEVAALDPFIFIPAPAPDPASAAEAGDANESAATTEIAATVSM